ncbi:MULTISPECIES: hypothetical protein [unclassified Bartonella]
MRINAILRDTMLRSMH